MNRSDLIIREEPVFPAAKPAVPETAACNSCIVTRPACGGCSNVPRNILAPVCSQIIDAERANGALRMVAQLKRHKHPMVIHFPGDVLG